MSNVTAQALGSAFVDKMRQAPNTDAAQLASDFEAFSAGLDGGSKAPFAEFVSNELEKSRETAWMAALIRQKGVEVGGLPRSEQTLLEIGKLNSQLSKKDQTTGTAIVFMAENQGIRPNDVAKTLEAGKPVDMQVVSWEKLTRGDRWGLFVGGGEVPTVLGHAVRSYSVDHTFSLSSAPEFLQAWDAVKAQLN